MRRILVVTVLFLVMILPSIAQVPERETEGFLPPGFDLFGRAFEEAISIKLENGLFVVNGEPVILKGVNYLWLRPAEDPLTGRLERLRFQKDILDIKAAGFNCLRITEANDWQLGLLRESGLLVLQQIWIDPTADLTDSRTLEEAVNRARRVAEYTRDYNNVIGYVIGDRPIVLRYRDRRSYQQTENFFREIALTIKWAHPGGRVSLLDRPDLAVLDHSFLDFITASTYSWTPAANYETGMGYRSLNEWLKARFTGGERKKPYINTAYGASVAPLELGPGYGGLSEAEQAEWSVAMLNDLVQSGAQGFHYIEWSDQWSRVPPNWVHNDHPEEWLGMLTYEPAPHPENITERLRPVYQAVGDYNWAIVMEPRDLSCYHPSVPVEVYCEPNVNHVSVTVDGGEEIALERRSLHWWSTRLELSEGSHTVIVVACDETGFCRAPDRRSFYVTADGRHADLRSVELILPGAAKKTDTILARAVVKDGLGRLVPQAPVDFTAVFHDQLGKESGSFIGSAVTDEEGVAVLAIPTGNHRGYVTITAGVDFPDLNNFSRRAGDMSFVWIQ